VPVGKRRRKLLSWLFSEIAGPTGQVVGSWSSSTPQRGNSSQERNFLPRPRGKLASFGSIAGAETAPTREFGRHAFEIAALLRVSHTTYNLRVWMVETVEIELAAQHTVVETSSY
jgi:hypothetical protein